MNYLHSIFLCLIVSSSVLLAQTDSTKKSFKPYSLIDAAPVAINKNDFKPQINFSIQSVDAITNLPIDAKINYYTFGDSTVTAKNGKTIFLAAQGNEKIIIVSNASGYIWQTQIFKTPLADTSYVLKFKKIIKGDEITIHNIDFSFKNNKFESFFYSDLMGIQEFLKLNSSVKIEIYCCPKDKEEVFFHLIKNSDKKRFHFKNCRNEERTDFKKITIKIIQT